MSNLLEQWNEHIVRGNKLSRELEDIEDLINKSKEAEICFSSGGSAIYIRVLSPEKMQEIRENTLVAIMGIRNEKESELEKLMGKQQVIPPYGKADVPEKRKPATINPDFEAAVKVMVESGGAHKKSNPVEVKDVTVIDAFAPDPVENKLTEILQTASKKIEDKPVPEEPSLDKYPAKKTAKQYPEDMDIATVKKMYVDEGKTATSIAAYFKLTTKEVANFITRNKISRSKPAETERP